ncbi:MAG: phosphoribosylformimino-5-aminoimidazole carboxamide ribotide isomerase [Planctomycetota bacterium]|jgi:phosphoribosylformimino-5-aminoimidazole carboxamide ribotide isomerase
MLIIPEIQIKGGKVVTRSARLGTDIVHSISPMEALKKFVDADAKMIQIVDIDAARSKQTNNEALIKQMIGETDKPIQVSGGIRTLSQISDWFEAGAARVVLGTVAITDAPLVKEAANRFPGGIIVHLATRNGHVVIDGWKTQTAFKPEDIIRELQVSGIAGVIHKATEDMNGELLEELALTEQLSHDVAIPVYSSGTVLTLDDISRLRYLPNINGAVISHALMTGDILLEDALQVAAQKDTSPEPESITPIVKMGVHKGIRAYLAAYNTSQASRVWNLGLREAITDANPYMEVSIPQHDLELDMAQLTPRDIQQCYEDELDNADIVIVILDGIENQAWTGFECGYARAKGKYIYGISADQEMSDSNQKRYAAMCDELVFYTPGDDLNASRSEISHTLATRTMVRNQ